MGLAEVAVPHDSNILLLVICSAAVVTPDNKMILPHEASLFSRHEDITLPWPAIADYFWKHYEAEHFYHHPNHSYYFHSVFHTGCVSVRGFPLFPGLKSIRGMHRFPS